MSFLKSRISFALAHPVSKSVERYKKFGLIFPASYDIGKNILVLKQNLNDLQIQHNQNQPEILDYRNYNLDCAISFINEKVFNNESVMHFYREDKLSEDKYLLHKASVDNIENEDIWQIKHSIQKNYESLVNHLEETLNGSDYKQLLENKEGRAVAKLFENLVKNINTRSQDILGKNSASTISI